MELARVTNCDGLSTCSSADSDPCDSSDLCKVGTSESTGSGEDAGKGRKRKSVERDTETNDGSEGEDVEGEDMEVENRAQKSAKQQKMKGPKRLREPRYQIKTRTEVDIMDDGYKWRKYGQKPVKNSPHPRNYYRCTTANCPVRKRVERSTEDPGLVVTSYEGTHTHPKVTQPKRTPSGNYTPYEPAESLSDALNQLNNRQHQAATNSTPPMPPAGLGLPNLSQLFPGWGPLMNRQAMPPVGPSFNDNVGLMMAYQIVRLQWELQAKVQQFISYNAQQGFGAGLPKMNPFMNPFLDPLGSAIPDFNALLSNYGEGSEAEDFTQERPSLPKVPETLTSSLLSRRAAMRSGSPLNPNLQSAMKMQQLMSQAMAGFHQAALDQQDHSLGEIADQGLAPDQRRNQ